MFEREYRDLAFVPRWSIIRQIKQQSVAEHSFYVALYAYQIARLINWKGDYGVLLHQALIHDLDEIITGDIVGPAKAHFVDEDKHHQYICKELNHRFSFSIRQIEPQEEKEINALIKIADGLDELFYLSGEMQMGNGTIGKLYKIIEKRWSNKIQMILEGIFNLNSVESSTIMMKIYSAVDSHTGGQSRVVE